MHERRNLPNSCISETIDQEAERRGMAGANLNDKGYGRGSPE